MLISFSNQWFQIKIAVSVHLTLVRTGKVNKQQTRLAEMWGKETSIFLYGWDFKLVTSPWNGGSFVIQITNYNNNETTLHASYSYRTK